MCAADTDMTFFFFFNDPATTEIYTLSLHDALPISRPADPRWSSRAASPGPGCKDPCRRHRRQDRKSTRLNSSHSQISYAVFCLKKKNSIGFIRGLSQYRFNALLCTCGTFLPDSRDR